MKKVKNTIKKVGMVLPVGALIMSPLGLISASTSNGSRDNTTQEKINQLLNQVFPDYQNNFKDNVIQGFKVYGDLNPSSYLSRQYGLDNDNKQLDFLRSDTRYFVGTSNPIDASDFSSKRIGNRGYLEKALSAIGLQVDTRPEGRYSINTKSPMWSQNAPLKANTQYLNAFTSLINDMFDKLSKPQSAQMIENSYNKFNELTISSNIVKDFNNSIIGDGSLIKTTSDNVEKLFNDNFYEGYGSKEKYNSNNITGSDWRIYYSREVANLLSKPENYNAIINKLIANNSVLTQSYSKDQLVKIYQSKLNNALQILRGDFSYLSTYKRLSGRLDFLRSMVIASFVKTQTVYNEFENLKNSLLKSNPEYLVLKDGKTLYLDLFKTIQDYIDTNFEKFYASSSDAVMKYAPLWTNEFTKFGTALQETVPAIQDAKIRNYSFMRKYLLNPLFETGFRDNTTITSLTYQSSPNLVNLRKTSSGYIFYGQLFNKIVKEYMKVHPNEEFTSDYKTNLNKVKEWFLNLISKGIQMDNLDKNFFGTMVINYTRNFASDDFKMLTGNQVLTRDFVSLTLLTLGALASGENEIQNAFYLDTNWDTAQSLREYSESKKKQWGSVGGTLTSLFSFLLGAGAWEAWADTSKAIYIDNFMHNKKSSIGTAYTLYSDNSYIKDGLISATNGFEKINFAPYLQFLVQNNTDGTSPILYQVENKEPLILNYDYNKLFTTNSILQGLATGKENAITIDSSQYEALYNAVAQYLEKQAKILNTDVVTLVNNNKNSFRFLVNYLVQNKKPDGLNLVWTLPMFDLNKPSDRKTMFQEGYNTLLEQYKTQFANGNEELKNELNVKFNLENMNDLNINTPEYYYKYTQSISKEYKELLKQYQELSSKDKLDSNEEKLKHDLEVKLFENFQPLSIKDYLTKYFAQSLSKSVYGNNLDEFLNNNWNKVIGDNLSTSLAKLFTLIQVDFGIKLENTIPYPSSFANFDNQINSLMAKYQGQINYLNDVIKQEIASNGNASDELIAKYQAAKTNFEDITKVSDAFAVLNQLLANRKIDASNKDFSKKLNFIAALDNISSNFYLLNNSYLNTQAKMLAQFKSFAIKKLVRKDFSERSLYDNLNIMSNGWRESIAATGKTLLNVFTLNFSGMADDWTDAATNIGNFNDIQDAKGLTFSAFSQLDQLVDFYGKIDKYQRYTLLANQIIKFYNLSNTDINALKQDSQFIAIVKEFTSDSFDINTLGDYEVASLAQTLLSALTNSIKTSIDSDGILSISNDNVPDSQYLEEFISKSLLLFKMAFDTQSQKAKFAQALESAKAQNKLVGKLDNLLNTYLDNSSKLLPELIKNDSFNNFGRFGLLVNDKKEQEAYVDAQIEDSLTTLSKIGFQDSMSKIKEFYLKQALSDPNPNVSEQDALNELNNNIKNLFLEIIPENLDLETKNKLESIFSKTLLDIIAVKRKSNQLLNDREKFMKEILTQYLTTPESRKKFIIGYSGQNIDVNNIPSDLKIDTSLMIASAIDNYLEIYENLGLNVYTQIFDDFGKQYNKAQSTINDKASLKTNASSDFVFQFVNEKLDDFNLLSSDNLTFIKNFPINYVFNVDQYSYYQNGVDFNESYGLDEILVNKVASKEVSETTKWDSFQKGLTTLGKWTLDNFGTNIYTKSFVFYKVFAQPVYSKIKYHSFFEVANNININKTAQKVVAIGRRNGEFISKANVINEIKNGKGALSSVEKSAYSAKRGFFGKITDFIRSGGRKSYDHAQSIMTKASNEFHILKGAQELGSNTKVIPEVSKLNIGLSKPIELNEKYLAAIGSYDPLSGKFNNKEILSFFKKSKDFNVGQTNKQMKIIFEHADDIFINGKEGALKAQKFISDAVAKGENPNTIANGLKEFFTTAGKETVLGIKEAEQTTQQVAKASKFAKMKGLFTGLKNIVKSNIIGFVIGVALDSLMNWITFDQNQMAGYWSPVNPEEYNNVITPETMFLDNETVVKLFNIKNLLNPVKITSSPVLDASILFNLVTNDEFRINLLSRVTKFDKSKISDKSSFEYALDQLVKENATIQLMQIPSNNKQIESWKKDNGATLNENASSTSPLFYSKEFNNQGVSSINTPKTPAKAYNQLLTKSTIIDFKMNFDQYMAHPLSEYIDIKGSNMGFVGSENGFFVGNDTNVGAYGGYVRFPLIDLYNGVSSVVYSTINDNQDSAWSNSSQELLKKYIDNAPIYRSQYKDNLTLGNLEVGQNAAEKASMKSVSYYNFIPFFGRIIANSQMDGTLAFNLDNAPKMSATPYIPLDLANNLIKELNGTSGVSRQNLLGYSQLTYQLVKLPNGNMGLKISQIIFDETSSAYKFHNTPVDLNFLNNFNSALIVPSAYVPTNYLKNALSAMQKNLSSFNSMILDPTSDLFAGSNIPRSNLEEFKQSKQTLIYNKDTNTNRFDNVFIESLSRHWKDQLLQGLSNTKGKISLITNEEINSQLNQGFNKTLSDFDITKVQMIPNFDKNNNLKSFKIMLTLKFNKLQYLNTSAPSFNITLMNPNDVSDFDNSFSTLSKVGNVEIVYSTKAQVKELLNGILKINNYSYDSFALTLKEHLDNSFSISDKDYDALIEQFKAKLKNNYLKNINDKKAQVLIAFFSNDFINRSKVEKILTSGTNEQISKELNAVYNSLLVDDKILLENNISAEINKLPSDKDMFNEWINNHISDSKETKAKLLSLELNKLYYNGKIYDNYNDLNQELNNDSFEKTIEVPDRFSFDLYANDVFSFAYGGSVTFSDNFNGKTYNLIQKWNSKLNTNQWVFENDLNNTAQELIWENLSYKSDMSNQKIAYSLNINRNIKVKNGDNDTLRTQNIVINFKTRNYSDANLTITRQNTSDIDTIYKSKYINLRELPLGKNLDNLELNDIKTIIDSGRINKLISSDPDALALDWINSNYEGSILANKITEYNNLKQLADPSRYDKFIVLNPFYIFKEPSEQTNNLISRVYNLVSNNRNKNLSDFWYSRNTTQIVNNDVPFNLMDVSYFFDSNNLITINVPSDQEVAYGITNDGVSVDSLHYIKPINGQIVLDLKDITKDTLYKLSFISNDNIIFNKYIFISPKNVIELRNLDTMSLLNNYLSINSNNKVQEFNASKYYFELDQFVKKYSLGADYNNVLKTYNLYKQYAYSKKVYNNSSLTYNSIQTKIKEHLNNIETILQDYFVKLGNIDTIAKYRNKFANSFVINNGEIARLNTLLNEINAQIRNLDFTMNDLNMKIKTNDKNIRELNKIINQYSNYDDKFIPYATFSELFAKVLKLKNETLLSSKTNLKLYYLQKYITTLLKQNNNIILSDDLLNKFNDFILNDGVILPSYEEFMHNDKDNLYALKTLENLSNLVSQDTIKKQAQNTLNNIIKPYLDNLINTLNYDKDQVSLQELINNDEKFVSWVSKDKTFYLGNDTSVLDFIKKQETSYNPDEYSFTLSSQHTYDNEVTIPRESETKPEIIKVYGLNALDNYEYIGNTLPSDMKVYIVVKIDENAKKVTVIIPDHIDALWLRKNYVYSFQNGKLVPQKADNEDNNVIISDIDLSIPNNYVDMLNALTGITFDNTTSQLIFKEHNLANLKDRISQVKNNNVATYLALAPDIVKDQWNKLQNDLKIDVNVSDLAKRNNLFIKWLSLNQLINTYDFNKYLNNLNYALYQNKENLNHKPYQDQLNNLQTQKEVINNQITKLSQKSSLPLITYLNQIKFFDKETYALDINFSNKIYTSNLEYLQDLVSYLKTNNKMESYLYKVALEFLDIETLIDKLNNLQDNILITSTSDTKAIKIYNDLFRTNLINTNFEKFFALLKLNPSLVEDDLLIKDPNLTWNGNIAYVDLENKTFTFNFVLTNSDNTKQDILILEVPFNKVQDNNNIKYVLLTNKDDINKVYDAQVGHFKDTLLLKKYPDLVNNLVSLHDNNDYLLVDKDIQNDIVIASEKIAHENKYIKNNLLAKLSSYFSQITLKQFNSLFAQDVISNIEDKNLFNYKYQLSVTQNGQDANAKYYTFVLENSLYKITINTVLLLSDLKIYDNSKVSVSVQYKQIDLEKQNSNLVVHPIYNDVNDFSIFDNKLIASKVTGVFDYNERYNQFLKPLFENQTRVWIKPSELKEVLELMNIKTTTTNDNMLLESLNLLNNDQYQNYNYALELANGIVGYDSQIDYDNNILILNWKLKIYEPYHKTIASKDFITIFKLSDNEYIKNNNVTFNSVNDSNINVTDNLTRLLEENITNAKNNFLIYSIRYSQNDYSNVFVNNIKSALKYLVLTNPYINEKYAHVNDFRNNNVVNDAVDYLYRTLALRSYFNNLSETMSFEEILKTLSENTLNKVFFMQPDVDKVDENNKIVTKAIVTTDNKIYQQYNQIYLKTLDLRNFTLSLKFTDNLDLVKQQMLKEKTIYDANGKVTINPFANSNLDFDGSEKYISWEVKEGKIYLTYSLKPQSVTLDKLLQDNEKSLGRDSANKLILERFALLQDKLDNLTELLSTTYEKDKNGYTRNPNKQVVTLDINIAYLNNLEEVTLSDNSWVWLNTFNNTVNVEDLKPNKVIKLDNVLFKVKGFTKNDDIHTVSNAINTYVKDGIRYIVYETYFDNYNITPVKTLIKVNLENNPDLENVDKESFLASLNQGINFNIPHYDIKEKDNLLVLNSKYNLELNKDYNPTLFASYYNNLNKDDSLLSSDSNPDSFMNKNKGWILPLIAILSAGLGVGLYIVIKKVKTKKSF